MAAAEREDDVVRAWGGKGIPWALGVLACVYFVSVWAEAAVRSGVSLKWLPAPLAYFAQIATLFPGPAASARDYRAEGFRCRDQQWTEIDVSPWFPIDAEHKENRFYRAIYFYRDHHTRGQTDHERRALRALDEFIVSHYNRDAIDAAAQGREVDPIGGVRVTRIDVPIGKPSDGSPRYQKKPLADYPDEQRRELYYTPESKREERCARIGR